MNHPEYDDEPLPIQSSSRRQFLTLGVGASLGCAYLVYSQVVGPLLNSGNSLRQIGQAVANQALSLQSHEHDQLAAEFLPDQEWARGNCIQYRANSAVVYTSDVTPTESDDAIVMKPFAMIWMPPDQDPEQRPISITAESAMIQFESEFDFNDPDPGRPIAGALNGGVRIEGPDGLYVEGQSFVFDESAMHVRCDHQVNFRYASHRGKADAMQIELIPDEDARQQRQFAVAGIKSLLLRSRVDLDLVLEDDDQPTNVKITSEGPFEFLLADNQATFQDEVWVWVDRENRREEYDSLYCDRLTLHFDRLGKNSSSEPENNLVLTDDGQLAPAVIRSPGETVTATDGVTTFGQMRFRWLHAEGQHVVLSSAKNHLRARMHDFRYEALNRRAELSMTDPLQHVDIRQDSSKLLVPHVQLTHEPGGQIVDVICTGNGRFDHADRETRELLFWAVWSDQLRKYADPQLDLDIVEVSGRVTVKHNQQNTTISGDQIQFWIDGQREKTADNNEGKNSPINSFRPHKLLADQNVVVESPQMRATTRQLEVRFEESSSVNPTASGGSILQTGGDDSQDKSNSPSSPRNSLFLDSEKIDILVVHDGQVREANVKEITTRGNVAVIQQMADSEEIIRLNGNELHIDNAIENGQEFALVGEPAWIEQGLIRIEANNVHLNRAANRAWVEGGGVLAMPVDRSLEGEQLAEPQTLDVHWSESMQFDGKSAFFYGDVNSTLGDHELACKQMQVTLTKPVSFAEARKQQDDRVEVHEVICREGVDLRSDAYEKNRLIEVRRAHFWQLRIEQQSGATEASGPGYMTRWSRSSGKRSPLSASTQGNANQPLALGTADWDYLRVDFAGVSEGNLRSRKMQFNDQVEILFGPVKHSLETIDIDQLPLDSGWLKCGQLEIRQLQPDNQADGRFEMLGKRNARIHAYTGHGFFDGLAGKVSYDDTSGLFTLSSEGGVATVWRQARLGGPRSEIVAKRIDCNPSTNYLKFDGAREVDGID